jgi:MFS family permease
MEEDSPTYMQLPEKHLVDNCINNQKKHYALFVSLCLAMGNVADAVEIMCVGFIMTEISYLSSLNKELLSAAVFMGMLIGGAAGGYISDYLGRRSCLLYSLGLNAVAGFFSSFSTNIELLIIFRLIAGLGIGGSVPIVFSLGAEIFPMSSRGRYLLVIASAWMVGAVFAALAAWLMLGTDINGHKILPGLNWRYYAAICSIPAFIAFFLCYAYVPESPRYLLRRGLLEETAKVLSTLSTVHVTPEMLAHEQIAFCAVPTSESNASNLTADQQQFSAPFASEEDTMVRKMRNDPFANIRILFVGHYLRTSLVLMIIWFTLSFGSYGIANWISTLFSDVGIGNPYAASFIFAMANLPGNLVSIWLIDRIGRRWLLTIGMVLAAVSVLGFALDQSDASVVVLSASLFNAFSVIGWNSLDCLAAEAFPTRSRTSAMGILAGFGRLGAICGQFVNGSLEKNIPALLFVTCASTLIGGIASWALPTDTANMALDDGDDRNGQMQSKLENGHVTRISTSLFSPDPSPNVSPSSSNTAWCKEAVGNPMQTTFQSTQQH